MKWISLVMTKEEHSKLEEMRKQVSESMGFNISRNAFVKRLLFGSLREEIETIFEAQG